MNLRLKNRWTHNWQWISAAVVAAALVAGFAARRSLGKPALMPVHVAIDRGDVVNNVEATGAVDAVTTVNIGAQVSGTITKVLVDFNDPVKEGQVLAVIDDSRYRAAATQAEADIMAARAAVQIAQEAVATARADLNVARANLARAQALARKAQSDYERQQQLYAADVSSAAERDRLKAEHESAVATAKSEEALVEQAKARVGSAEAQLAQARAQAKERVAALELARTNLSYTVIRSPIDGVVVARNIEAGQTVASRLSTPNLFNIAKNLEHMYVYTKLDVLDVPRVKPGQSATFTVDAYPNRQWEGRVVQVRIAPVTQQRGQAAPSALPSQLASGQQQIPGLQQQTGGGSGSAPAPAGSAGPPAGMGAPAGAGSQQSSTATGTGTGSGLVNYDALVEFTNSDLRLLPGMTAYVSIPVSAVHGVVRVRKEALRAAPSISAEEKHSLLARSGAAGKSAVWILEEGRYRPVPVEVGITDPLFAEIKGGQVNEGQQVLTGYRPRQP